jgi:hypothetical protein
MAAQQTAIVDKLLTDVSNAYIPQGFISEQALPSLSVKQKTGIIGAYGNDHIRIVDDLVGGQAMAKRIEPISRQKTNLYSIQSHALNGLVTEDDYDNVEQPFDAEKDLTMGLTSLIMINKEKALADTLFDTSVMTKNTTLSAAEDKFSDYVNSSPTEVFKDAQLSVLDNCGMAPNAAVMSKKVFMTLQYHPQILESLGFAYNRAGQLTEQEIAKVLGVQALLIGDAAYNAGVKGNADSFSQIWGDSILLYVKPQSAAKYQTALGYYMKLSSRAPRRVFKTAQDNPANSMQILVDDAYSFELVNVNAGYLIKSVL